MLNILIFRIILLSSFIIIAYTLGDWNRIEKYYPTILFAMVVNMTVSFLTYHHILWHFNPDYLVKTYTLVEMLNSYIVLPSTVFVFLSKLPSSSNILQYVYIGLWIIIYSLIELIDYTIGGISYQHGWSWQISTMFDSAIFSILRIHYTRPIWAWGITFLLGAVILTVFNFSSAEMK
jgi:hypothetical protein